MNELEIKNRNQTKYNIIYNDVNSGTMAARKLDKQQISEECKILNIKWRWNIYCNSLFDNTECGPSKCDKIHYFVSEMEAIHGYVWNIHVFMYAWIMCI